MGVAADRVSDDGRVRQAAAGDQSRRSTGRADELTCRTSSRTIGTVEAFLILSEWPPRAEYLMDSVLPRASSSGDRPNPAKVYDDLSWTLIGLVSVVVVD